MRDIASTLPWGDNDNRLIYGQVLGDHDDAPFIADVCTDPDAYTTFEQAKAEFIVRACNTHAELVRCLAQLIGLAETADAQPREAHGLIAAARAILAIATQAPAVGPE